MAQLMSNFGADLTGPRQGASCAAREKAPPFLYPIRVCRHALAALALVSVTAEWAHYPLVLFATLARNTASKAIISGAYSLTQQTIQLGFLPRMRALHTASHERGQIYIPLVNRLLAAGSLGAVITFGSSEALGGAYGIAVSMLMAITTVLAGLVALQWGFNPLAIIAVNGSFLVIDLIFVAANGIKVLEGGWFPLLLAGLVAFLMLAWRTGWLLLEDARSRLRQREDEFVEWVLRN